MHLDQYIHNALPPLKDSDSLKKGLRWMDEFKVMHLPILNEKGVLLGIVSEEDIIDNDDILKTFKETSIHYQMLFASNTAHILDIIKLFAHTSSSVVPIIDKKEKYIGCISYDSLMKQMGHISFFCDPGGIIALEMNHHDYTLTQIANIVEGNGAKLLGVYVKNHEDSTKITVTIKINRNEISDIIQTFNRYEYSIVGTFSASEYNDDLQDKLDQFMNYLNV